MAREVTDILVHKGDQQVARSVASNRAARLSPQGLDKLVEREIASQTALFRQINVDCPHIHHDALEFPNGEVVLLTFLIEGQLATVLQLPADPHVVPAADRTLVTA